MDEKDLIFNLPDYRWLWQVILELETQITKPRDLMSALQNHLLMITTDKNRDFNSLFNLNEHTSQEILQPEEQIKDAIIAIFASSVSPICKCTFYYNSSTVPIYFF